jgi:hypothetical protein
MCFAIAGHSKETAFKSFLSCTISFFLAVIFILMMHFYKRLGSRELKIPRSMDSLGCCFMIFREHKEKALELSLRELTIQRVWGSANVPKSEPLACMPNLGIGCGFASLTSTHAILSR